MHDRLIVAQGSDAEPRGDQTCEHAPLYRIVDFRHRRIPSRRVAQFIDAHQAAEQTVYGI
jgi:hypothetical protein